MRSTVTTKGHAVVPKKLRDRFKITPGTLLDWREDGDSMRVVKLAPAAKSKTGLDWFRRLGRVPAAPRDTRKVQRP
ncbi:MAG: AbrB/MazE/SpoVT family DNA-binding domain-containing protein [Limisphaerales bacterium]